MTQHRKPCRECPFRRVSLKGWLGAASPEEFISIAESDAHMPCHCRVDYEDPNWQALVLAAPMCAGRAQYFRNQCKMPRANPALAELVRSMEPDHKVFRFRSEFLAHHGSKYQP